MMLAMTHYIENMHLSYKLREPTLRLAIDALQLPSGSQGLDVGCGIGTISRYLAEAVSPDGHVTGVDISLELIAYAGEAAKKSGLSKQLTFREGDMNALPFDDNTFDWVISIDCAGYAPVEPLPLIEELIRVVKPGGKAAIMAWSSQLLLPGHPTLEARLNATAAGIAPFSQGKSPEKHFTRALGWFRQLGLKSPKAQTFIGEAHAPLSDEHHQALSALIEMRWPGVQDELARDDWDEYQRFCRPDSPAFILDSPEYYAFFTYTLFSAIV